jgi:hypothetical protein
MLNYVDATGLVREPTIEENKVEQEFFNNFMANNQANAPKKSDLARERKVQVPKQGKKRKFRHTASDVTTISAAQRVAQYTTHPYDEPFRSNNGELWCDGCNESLSKKKTSIEQHRDTRKHSDNVEIFRSNKRRKILYQSIITEGKNAVVRMAGATLSDATMENRVIVLTALMFNGVGTNCLSNPKNPLKIALEEGRGSCPRRQTADLTPVVQKIEFKEVFRELSEDAEIMSFSMDCACDDAEILAIVVKFWSKRNQKFEMRFVYCSLYSLFFSIFV